MINRDSYLSQIRPFMDKAELIKVIIGARHSGKSIMLELIQDELAENGIPREKMISMNFEDITFSPLTTASVLLDYLKSKIDAIDGRAYLFLDEIQEVVDWEKCVNSLRVNSDVDIYITGSNSILLSGECATLLSGRYVEFSMFPFSFSEYCEAKKELGENKSVRDYFYEYVKYGGLPFLVTTDLVETAKMQYLKDIY